MKYEYDVLINYSELDNSPKGNDQGWVENFGKFLELMLFQIMGRKPAILMKSDSAHLSESEVSGSSLMVCILSENFVSSGNCLDSLAAYQSATDSNVKDESLRVFKVQKVLLEYENQPESIRDLISYDLFEMDEVTGTGIEFIDYFGPDAERNYWMKMVDLAYDIYESLIVYQEEVNGATVKPLFKRKSIFLAETSHDLTVQRNIIRRELQRHGFKVLPTRALPKDLDEFEKIVESNLKQCDLSIHLIGSSYGTVLSGADRSIVDIQNKIAGELSGEQTRDKSDDRFSRFIWISPTLRSVSEKQMAFIENLKRDIASLEGAEILETPLEDFKNIIRQELAEDRSFIGKQDNLTDSGDQQSVYLIYDQVDKKGVEPLARLIEKNDMKVIHPQFDKELLVARQHHIDRLVNFDIALIFKQSVNDQWVKMKVLDLLKAPGFGRSKPVLGRAIVTGPGVKTEADLFAGHEISIIESPKDGLQQEEITDFLKNAIKVL